jgi:hypothetical protein
MFKIRISVCTVIAIAAMFCTNVVAQALIVRTGDTISLACHSDREFLGYLDGNPGAGSLMLSPQYDTNGGAKWKAASRSGMHIQLELQRSGAGPKWLGLEAADDERQTKAYLVNSDSREKNLTMHPDTREVTIKAVFSRVRNPNPTYQTLIGFTNGRRVAVAHGRTN